MKIYEGKMQWMVKEDGPAVQLNRPEFITDYMRGAFDEHPLQESFWVICLNRKNFAIDRHMITLGTMTSSLAHPREILRAVILGNAASFVCVHNHPSGDPSPSDADLQVTRKIREAATAIDIPFLDHVIIGTVESDPRKRGFYSFREQGII